MKKILIIFSIVLIIIAFSLAMIIYTTQTNLSKHHIKKELIIDIPKHSDLNTIIDKFNKKNELLPKFKYYLIIKYYTKFQNKKLIAGTYRFKKGTPYSEVISSLFKGTHQYFIKITYPEGITYKDFAKITEKHLFIPSNQFIEYVNSKELLKKYKINAQTIEGYLYPSTYFFKPNSSLEQIIDKLISTLFDIWNKNFKNQADKSGYSMHTILTLASIIEAEAPAIEERKRISGVYHNRLKNHILLQADPTIQYALNGKKRVLYKDLIINNPYNTYKFAGLPPGPINSPGFTAIEAALNPERHNYFFFVAIGDSSGRHYFATNLKDHKKNVIKYREKRKK